MSDPLFDFISVWGNGYLAHDIGRHLTCDEVEALASLFLSVGRTDACDEWISSHAEGDDCDDQHCTCTNCTTESPEETP